MMKEKSSRSISGPREHSRRCRRRLGIVLVAAGVLIIGGLITESLFHHFKAQRLLKEARGNLISVSEFIEDFSAESGLVSEPVTDSAGADAAQETGAQLQTWGILRIPAIDLEEIVSEGTSDYTLNYSIGHMEDTAFPSEEGGNCVLSGHRSYTHGRNFNRLDELSPGDELWLETAEQTYHYIVTETFVVTPDEVSVLDATMEPTLTLITCTPIYTATHRLIVRCTLD